MKLKKAIIKNYLSIKDMEVDFDPQCRILVGINESGKTNILKALNFLDSDIIPTRKDLRELPMGETAIKEAYIRFVFDFSKEEVEELVEESGEKILTKDIKKKIITIDGKDFNLEEFFSSREGLYIANIFTPGKYASLWSLSKVSISSEWKTVSSTCPPTFTVSNGEEDVLLNLFTVVNTKDYESIPAGYLENLTTEKLVNFINKAIKEKITLSLPKVLFWDYDESNLLPSKVNLVTFCTDPTKCLPLKRMFQLDGVDDIKKAVDSAKSGSANSLTNLLRHVADKTSKHFHKTWKEYANIKFSLRIDGEFIVPTIEDKSNHYELSQRSDGFKRFVTFLLMVSAEAKSNLLKDTLLLIDEPEIGLHPTGARYLRDELIEIAKTNIVVFSTHSIFLIDNGLIKRHLIVKKENEITTVETVTESNLQDEEVIFKSLGYSIFSNLKEKNIIFEGWRDKKLFEVAFSKVPTTFSHIKEPLSKTGYCFSQGVKHMKNITPLFEAGDRKCLILSDKDSMAISEQKQYKEDKGYGVWKKYDEIVAGTTAVTGEDFIKEDPFIVLLKEISIRLAIPEMLVTDLNGTQGRIYVIRQWLSRNGKNKEEVEKIIEEVKTHIFENLKNSEIKTEYYSYLEAVVTQLSTL